MAGLHSSDEGRKTGARWFAINTLVHREDVAERHLVRQGFDVFIPRRRRTVRHARRLITKSAPFFPGYIFTSFDVAATRWRAVNGTIGVRALVTDGERPTPMPRGVVENLQGLTNADGIVEFDAGLREGGRVRILSGPFADLVGELLRMDDNGRIRVLLEIMNGSVPIALDRRDVIAAE